MNAAEFINKCDWEGGLAQFFDYGFQPTQLELTVDPEFRKVVYRAYEAWKDFQEQQDKYYTLVESGEY